MKSAVHSELFWNEPYKLELTRAVDPLGFDALREAMSNILAPFLTAGTRHAEHYVAVTVGLRWAKGRCENSIDKKIWPFFGAFERGLLQYWHCDPRNRPARLDYLGKNSIKDICNGRAPNIDKQILADQRATGLLGRYIESLRAIGLIHAGRIATDDSAVTKFLGDPQFEWDGRTPGSWSRLSAIFSPVDVRTAWPRLGKNLFDLADHPQQRIQMNCTARAICTSPGARWVQLANSSKLLEPQRRIAAATAPTEELETQLRDIFSTLLRGRPAPVSTETTTRIQRLASQITERRVISTVWPGKPPIAQVLEKQIGTVATGRLSQEALLKWHLEVMEARGVEPWLLDMGERSTRTLPTTRASPDSRLTNIRTLIGETKWAA